MARWWHRTSRSLPLVSLTALLLLPGAAGATAIEELEWLAGCWASELEGPGSGEHWLAPAGGTMLGVSRTVRGGRTVAWEFVRIAEVAPGKLAYIAQPSGQREATFPLLRIGDRELVFENLEHDYPQRVIYRLQGDRLQARIEGTHEGQPNSIEFPLRRAPCDPPLPGP
jgi:hypothetical protein